MSRERPGRPASTDEGASDDSMAAPGATRSGFAMPSYHVGPRELNAAMRSSERFSVPAVCAAPTVMADGALPGDVMPP